VEEFALIRYLYFVEIILSVAVMVAVLLQARETDLGGIFGGGSQVQHTRRGVERTLYNATIGLCASFLVVSLVIVAFA
jgi:preprotein translocase subunit SecG